jgi:sugar O-acyltransferase (sialic acid O-acetyltransferase NeuD family)
MTKDQLFGKPVTAFEDILDNYPPAQVKLFTAITFTKFNRVRMRLYSKCKEMGYSFANYVSSRAFVWRNVKIGENTFIFEDNTIQYNVEIGNNVVLWSGNHIGHRTRINDNCFLTSHVVVSGYCNIGENSFIGVNATIGDFVEIPKDSLIAAGAVIVKSLTTPGLIYMGNPAKPTEKTVYEKFGIGDEGE